jgi:hypothetical protein
VNTYSINDGNSNPNMPAPIYGIKIGSSTTASTTFSFDIFRAPTWGDFYAKDGNAGGGTNSAWNSGLGQIADPAFDPNTYPANPSVNDSYFSFDNGNGQFFYKILRPDTEGGGGGGEIPAPPSVVLAAIGGVSWFGSAFIRRRKLAVAG